MTGVPRVETVVGLGVLVMVSPVFWLAGTVTWFEVPVMVPPPGGVPVAVEVSLIEPLLRSAWVTL